jgi:hypothetical protein
MTLNLYRSLRLYRGRVRFLSVIPFNLADIGEGIAEVELMKWFVKVDIKFINNFSLLKNFPYIEGR